MPFRKREVATAVFKGKDMRMKSGEKMSPPPSPTMVRTSDIKKMKGRRASLCMVI